MHRTQAARAARNIDEREGLVVVNFRGCGSRELSEVYQAFGFLCARHRVRWALLKSGDEAADAHYALRDILGSLGGIAGIPLRFRLALLASSGPIAEVFETAQRGLQALGCEARVFRGETRANQWLCGASERRRRAAASGADFVCPGRPYLDRSRGTSPCRLSYSCLIEP